MGPRCSDLSAPGKACIRWGTRTKARQRYYDESVLEIHRQRKTQRDVLQYPSKLWETEPEITTE